MFYLLKRSLGFLILLLIFALTTVTAQAQPGYAWVAGMGGTMNDQTGGIAIDASGNSYMAGGFRGTIDADPGPGVFNLTAAGNDDIFVVKLDPNGNFVWAKGMGQSGQDRAADIAVDPYGNIYLTGEFWGTMDFDPGPGVYNVFTHGSQEVFVCKLTTNGNFVWAKGLGGSDTERGYSIALDILGNVYTTGLFFDSGDFDPGSGIFYLYGPTGVPDVFVSKLDSSGNFIWAKGFGGSSTDNGMAIAVDKAFNVFVSGYFSGTADFDPGPGIYNLSTSGAQNGFVCKLDAVGNFGWAKAMGNRASAIGLDPEGNVLTTGAFSGTKDFDPGAGTYSLSSAGGVDCFVSKLDSNGNFMHALRFGGSGDDEGYALTSDALGDIYVGGQFNSTVDFDPGAGIYALTSAGSYDAFVSKLDSAGSFQWAIKTGSTSGDRITDVRRHIGSSLFVTGTFSNTVDFDPGAGIDSVVSHGLTDQFVLKLQTCNPTYSTVTVSACQSYTAPSGQILTVTGTYTDFIANHVGCDSIITVQLTVFTNSASTISPDACDTYIAPDGQVYTSTGNYTAVIPNVGGCDSVITIDLTVNHSSSSTIQPVVCDSYTAADGQVYTSTGNYIAIIPNAGGCDSVITVNLTVNHSSSSTIQPVACDFYVGPDGQAYSNSGNFVTTIPNAAGCDSTITVQLTVLHVQATVTNISPILVANPAGAQYQWVDCDNGYASLQGETNQVFPATVSGSYAVVVTVGNCIDTSACETVSFVNRLEPGAIDIVVYPNPSQGVFTVACGQPGELRVYSATGAMVHCQGLERSPALVDLSGLADGIYWLALVHEGGVAGRKLVLEKSQSN